MTLTTDADYTAHFDVEAAPSAVLQALTTTAGVTSWWTAWTSVTGSGDEGGDLHFSFGGEDQLVVHVDAARPTAVAWSVHECAVLPDWAGTRPTFTMHPRPGGGTEVHFHHVGLGPALECFGVCRKDWDHYLAGLRAHLTTA